MQLGGICLNWGCIPTKALLRTSEIYHTLHHLENMACRPRTSAMIPRRWSSVSQGGEAAVGRGEVPAAQEQGHRHRRLPARLAGKGKIAVAKDGKPVDDVSCQTYHFGHRRPGAFAAGAGAGRQDWSGPIRRQWSQHRSRNRCWSSDRAPSASNSPAFTGQWAPRLRSSRCWTAYLPVEDEDISAFARKQFEKQGMKILTAAKVAKLDKARTASRRRSSRAANRPRSPSSASFWRSASPAMSRISAWKAPR